MLFVFHIWPSIVLAEEHNRRDGQYKRYERRKSHYDYNDLKRQVKKEDEGNKITGQTAAWLLVAANMSVAFSIFMKGMSRYFPLEPETKSSIKRF